MYCLKGLTYVWLGTHPPNPWKLRTSAATYRHWWSQRSSKSKEAFLLRYFFLFSCLLIHVCILAWFYIIQSHKQAFYNIFYLRNLRISKNLEESTTIFQYRYGVGNFFGDMSSAKVMAERRRERWAIIFSLFIFSSSSSHVSLLLDIH